MILQNRDKSKYMEVIMKKRTAILRGIAGIMAFLLFICTSATTLTFRYAGVINSALNLTTSKIVQNDAEDAASAIVYDNPYDIDSSNNQAALLLELDVAAENITQAQEGTVLLKNENGALPLHQGAGVTVFGNGSFHSVGASTRTPFDSIVPSTLVSALQAELGEENVNAVLGETAYGSLGTTNGSQVAEGEIKDVRAQEATWKDSCNDAAIVVLSRAGGEGNDPVMVTQEGRHYLNLSKNEEDLMAYLKEQKAAGILKSIIVLINSEQAMELGWLDDYDVDACMIIGRTGTTGYTGVVNVLVGAANPSGHAVDTYAVNSLSSPAITYAAGNTQKWTNLDWVAANDADAGSEESEDNWILYAEGIYVGYKYYETRYEDTVMHSGNAASTVGSSSGNAWNYTEEVAFPFGYGLSYTSFAQKLDKVEYDVQKDAYLVDVTVTNTGDTAGMDVVQVYAQTPYGEYEKQNKVEKAAVQLVGFGKTSELAPGASETVTVEVERYFLASYDAYGAQGYILSAGDYYLAIGQNAHDALNNVLAVKGFTTADGMDYSGDETMVHTWSQENLDTQSYKLSRFNDTKVTNQFEKADVNYYGTDFTYLSRSDWEGTYPEKAIKLAMTAEMLEDMVANWYSAEEYDTGEEFVFGADNGLTFADLYNTDYDDEETWNAFLDQLTVDDMLNLISDNDGYVAVDSVGMPSAKRTDDNSGIGSLVCNGSRCLSWVSESTTSRTWNTDRFSARGQLLGIEALFCNATEIWYGGGDLHRTPFGGRNQQYYSEDGNLGYIVGAHEAAAMQSVGVTFCIKHFALNDQETARGGVVTFTNEQAMREIYLRAFEGAFCEGGALSVMTAFNRIGCIPNNANSALLQNVLRGEWGFKGHITSDGYSSAAYKNHFAEYLVTGQDYYCLDANAYKSAIGKLVDAGDTSIIAYLRRAAKNDLYVISRSFAVNGLTSGSTVVTIVPWWQQAMLIATAVFGVSFLACTVVSVVDTVKQKKRTEEDNV